ncbi:prepilin-type N-terminal cleavage/methylation domain-containing protein [Comamonas fluminis]|uniref:prepilin-type N-terminal cleavage/methylation domain-containing protein n=1 Tax=Comamonas fluminis TaxID=2796366 RepID=UPI001C44B757|nr:prepilin-type N-terminal cleavage/methylation domain-containing protein [Comamonas fluminis]
MAQLKHAGFTLLELLVVISIMALATAGVSLAIRDNGGQQLEREAERLATLLESARAQARANGTLVVWRPMPQGFRFEGLPPGVKMPMQWLQTPVTVQPSTPVVLGPEPLIPRQTITLSLPDNSSPALQLVTDGLRPFKVQSLQGGRP